MRANLPSDEDGGQNKVFIDPRQNPGAVWTNLDSSHSGHERNHVFMNGAEANEEPVFVEISGVSGLDSPSDARAMVVWDYDHDGWPDVAIANANAPLLEMYRNRLASSPAAADGNGQFVALRFVGGNDQPGPSKLSPRDGYGALVVADLGDIELHREHRSGEGFASQNSSTMLIGIGKHSRVASLRVRWPSGTVREVADVPAGKLVTAYEDPTQSPNGEPFVIEGYGAIEESDGESERVTTHVSFASTTGSAKLRLYTTVATTCAACVAKLPDLAFLRSVFTDDQLVLYGVPTDPEDDAEELETWMSDHEPVYELVPETTPAELASVAAVLHERLGLKDALGATIVTDAEGRVLLTRIGTPSVSELRRLLVDGSDG